MIRTRGRGSAVMTLKLPAIAVFASFLVIAGIAAMAYLFRRDTDDNEALGILDYCYSWGHVKFVGADRDRDGRQDIRCLVAAPFGPYSPHLVSPLECWDRLDGRGVFRRHMILDRSGAVKRIEVDDDGDGVYEKSLAEQPGTIPPEMPWLAQP